MKNIALIAIDPSFGASANLVNALRQAGHSVLPIFKNRDPKEFWKTVEHPLYADGYLWSADIFKGIEHNIYVGSNAYKWYQTAKDIPTTVILTDTHYIENHKRLNAEFEAAGVTVFAMPDLYPYREGKPTLPYYPPFSLEHIPIKKNKHFTICHSPGDKAASNKKGSIEIRKAVERFMKQYPETEYLELTGLSHEECLRQKAKAHVFIDQMVPEGSMPHGYKGGIGKSGVEAMHLGCLVFTSGNRMQHSNMPTPPIMYLDVGILYTAIAGEYLDFELCKSNGRSCWYWAKKYTSYEFVAQHVLQTL